MWVLFPSNGCSLGKVVGGAFWLSVSWGRQFEFPRPDLWHQSLVLLSIQRAFPGDQKRSGYLLVLYLGVWSPRSCLYASIRVFVAVIKNTDFAGSQTWLKFSLTAY